MKKNLKKSFLLLIAIAALLIMTVGGTVAYLVTSDGPVENKFEPVEVTTGIDEDFTNTTVKKNVKITNTGDIPVYVRAKVVANWCDKNGNIVAPWTDNIKYNDTKWTKSTSDGYWYYKGAVEVGSSTANLFDSYSYKFTDIPDGADHLEMTIVHQSVQAEPDDAVTELWGNQAAGLVKSN